MISPDPYRVLTLLAEAEGFTAMPTVVNGARYRKGDVQVRASRESDSNGGTVTVTATVAPAVGKVAELVLSTGDIPGPMTLELLRVFFKTMGGLSSAVL